MQAEKNKALVQRYFAEVWNMGDLDAADEILHVGFSLAGGTFTGREAVKLYISSYRELYPQVHFTLLSLLAEGDTVVASWVATRAQPPHCEDAAAGGTATRTGMSVYRIAGSKIEEAWAGTDYACAVERHRLGSTCGN
jgi:predicted SnoaL-like aldol condensation-catalyzing enzyme